MAVKKATKDQGPDVVFNFVGTTPTVMQSLKMVSRGGKTVIVGLYRGIAELDVKKHLHEESYIRTPMDHTKWDLKKTIDLVVNGKSIFQKR